jgi:prephenate dehydratase
MSKVAIQGIRGSYSEEAVNRLFCGDAEMLECGTFGDVFIALSEGLADYAVVPVRNSIVGEIEPVSAVLRDVGLTVVDKLSLEIDHILAGTVDADLNELTSVRSHVEALKQCGRFLHSRPEIRRLTGADTASSIKQVVSENEPLNAAIGSRRAAEIYGAKILCESVADQPNNKTTFYLISNQ